MARAWFDRFEGAGLDGIVAKDPAGPYLPDERAMVKIKHERTADCVVAGYREHKSGPIVGSLLLGLYDDRGRLQHVGVSAAFTAVRRAELVDELAPYRLEDVSGHPWAHWAEAEAHEADRLPGAVTRWSSGRLSEWVPLRPELVCEVAYDHVQGDRFRHTTRFRRWRPTRTPATARTNNSPNRRATTSPTSSTRADATSRGSAPDVHRPAPAARVRPRTRVHSNFPIVPSRYRSWTRAGGS